MQGGVCVTRMTGFLTVPRFALKCLPLKGKKQEKPSARALACPRVREVFLSCDGSFLEDSSYHFHLLAELSSDTFVYRSADCIRLIYAVLTSIDREQGRKHCHCFFLLSVLPDVNSKPEHRVTG